MTTKLPARKDTRRLLDLESVGAATLKDFEVLGINEVEQLLGKSAETLYQTLCLATQQTHDPCVMDVFAAAIAQAENPRLPAAKKKWWFWSRQRKARATKHSHSPNPKLFDSK